MTYLRILLFPVLLLALAAPVLAQGTSVAFGTIRQDTDQPVEVTADKLSVDQETGTAIFEGNITNWTTVLVKWLHVGAVPEKKQQTIMGSSFVGVVATPPNPLPCG